MLNYLLDKIAGPKCIELKVQNPEKFSFKPKELLSLTSDIFLKLSAHAAFAPAVIRDGRSYNPQVSRISLNPKPGVFNSRCDHKQELLTSLLFALRRSYNPQVLRKVVRLLSTHSLQDQAWLERLVCDDPDQGGFKREELQDFVQFCTSRKTFRAFVAHDPALDDIVVRVYTPPPGRSYCPTASTCNRELQLPCGYADAAALSRGMREALQNHRCNEELQEDRVSFAYS